MPLASRLRRTIWSVPLGLQLSAIYALLLAVVLVLLGVTLYSQLNSFLIQNTAERVMRVTTSVLARPLPPERGRGDRGRVDFNAQDYIEQTATSLVRNLSTGDSAVAVLDDHGSVITSTQTLVMGEEPHIPALPADWQARLEGKTTGQWIANEPGRTRQLVLLTPIRIENIPASPQLYLQQVTSLEAADDILNALSLYLGLGILAATLVGVLALLGITRVVLKPLDRMARTAEAISAGDLDRRVRLPEGRNEVARVGHAFDTMVERLSSTLHAQRRFIADASHELRTPLTSLEGLSEMMLMGADRGDTNSVRRTVRSMHNELRRLSRLVTDLLTLSRLDSTAPMQFVPVDVGHLLREVADQMAPLADSRGVNLTVQSSEGATVRAEPDRLKQVVLNLVDNALRYTPEGGEVSMLAELDQAMQRVQITVRDTGQGIAPADLPNIFDRFYRGDVSRARATGNSGLGLAIVYAIVQSHNGAITVDSKVGEGTCFVVTLPALRSTLPVRSTTPVASSLEAAVLGAVSSKPE